jgi:hypothetical protein
MKHELIFDVLKSNLEKMKNNFTNCYLPELAVRMKLQILDYIAN